MYLAKPVLVKGGVILSGGSLGAYGISKAVAKETTSNNPSTDSDDSTGVVVNRYEEEIIPLADKAGFGTSNSEYTNNGGTFGYAYGRFMADTDGNEEFWKNQYEDLQKNQNLHSEFKNLGNDKEVLKNKCKEIYKKQKSSVDEELAKAAWSNCSPIYLKPNFVSYDDDKYKDKWASLNGNKNALLRASNIVQDAWNSLFKLLKKHLEDTSKKENIHSKLQSASTYSDLLKFCNDAYDSDAIETSSTYGNNAREYCLLDASATLEKYPTEPTT